MLGKQRSLLLVAAAAITVVAAPTPDAIALQIHVSPTPGVEAIPYAYGVMFEDINHCGDGGLYAELIQNRAFQALTLEEATVDPWFGIGGSVLTLRDYNSLSVALPYYVNVATSSAAGGRVGLANPGYWGIDVRPQKYTGSFYVMGAYEGNFYMTLGSNLTTDVFATTTVAAKSARNRWTQVHYTLEPSAAAPNSNNTLSIVFDAASAVDGSLNFELLSLFPPTYNNRPNGLRIDLMDSLSQLTPSYLRFPGGNNLEGLSPTTSTRWIWNETIGPLKNRPGRLGTWSYYNTDGLGLHEYLDWCEDLQMEPVYAVWAGLYLDSEYIAQADLEPYIDEALNSIAYITDPPDTYWGKMRASNGRKMPWKLNYVEIGNEDFLIANGPTTYVDYRYPMYYNAITKAYPNITTFASYTNLPQAAGAYNDFHIYAWPDDFVNRYYNFSPPSSDGQRPLIESSRNPSMIGEFASVFNNTGTDIVNFGDLNPHPTWIGSVAESVWLLSLEQHADAIFGASYAPTFQNLNSWEWGTDMISFEADTTKTVHSTSWHTIKLLSGTRFTQTRNVSSSLPAGPVYWAAGINEDTGSNIIKLATYNTTGGFTVPMAVTFAGIGKGHMANLTVLTAPDGYSFSGVGFDPVTATTEMLVAGDNGVYTFGLPDLAVAVLATMPKGFKGTTGDATNFMGFGGYGGCKGNRAKTSTGNGC